jgi:hypothetical protein
MYQPHQESSGIPVHWECKNIPQGKTCSIAGGLTAPKTKAPRTRLLAGHFPGHATFELKAMPVTEEPLREGSIVVIEEKRIRVRRLPSGTLRVRRVALRLCNLVAPRDRSPAGGLDRLRKDQELVVDSPPAAAQRHAVLADGPRSGQRISSEPARTLRATLFFVICLISHAETGVR